MTIEDKSKNFGSTDKKKHAWDDISSNCAQSGTTRRDSLQLRVWWDNSNKRAKKDISKRKRLVKKTGGGPAVEPPHLPIGTARIMSIIPSQMRSLDNEFDCDENERYESDEINVNSTFDSVDHIIAETEDAEIPVLYPSSSRKKTKV